MDFRIAPSLFGQNHVSPLITEYLDLYPSVRVEALFVDRVVHLTDEAVDVAVRIAHLPDSTLIASKVGQVQSTICGSPAYFEKHGVPQVPEDLSAHNLIMAEYSPSRREWHFSGDVVVPIAPRLIYSSVPAALDAARSGWGLTRTLSYQITGDLESGALKTVLSDHAPEPVPIYVVHAESRHSSARVRPFVDLAVARMRANPHLR